MIGKFKTPEALLRSYECLEKAFTQKGETNMKIQFNTSNAAFEEYGMEYQIELIFKRILHRIRNGETEGKIQDINGNNIGSWSI